MPRRHVPKKFLSAKKEFNSPSMNCKVVVAAMRALTEEEERQLMRAIDALLAHWAERLYGRTTGGANHVRKNEHQRNALRGTSAQQ
jgi:hypothetical protein